MPTSKYKRRKEMSIPDHFVPRFWDEVDGRSIIYKKITERINRLMEDAGVDSIQKELIAQECIFVAVQLETMRVKAAETGDFNSGSYTQMVNCLSGLLSKLGLERQDVRKVVTLHDYVKGGGA